MKRTTKLIILVALFILAHLTAVLIYLSDSPAVYPWDLDPTYSKQVTGRSIWDTVRVEGKAVLVIESVKGSSGGYLEVISPPAAALNHSLVLTTEFAKNLKMRTRGDTLFLSVDGGRKFCDLKYYSNDLTTLICHSRHWVSLIGVNADRFHIETLQEHVGLYDTCKIGVLSTLSNRFLLVNNCTVDELKSNNELSFRYRLEKGCLIRSHSYYDKNPRKLNH